MKSKEILLNALNRRHTHTRTRRATEICDPTGLNVQTKLNCVIALNAHECFTDTSSKKKIPPHLAHLCAYVCVCVTDICSQQRKNLFEPNASRTVKATHRVVALACSQTTNPIPLHSVSFSLSLSASAFASIHTHKDAMLFKYMLNRLLASSNQLCFACEAYEA